MLIAVIVVIGILLFLALVLAIARRRDTERAVGVLSRDTRRRDRSDQAVRPLAEEAPVLTGRQVEKQAARERAAGGVTATGTAVVVAGGGVPARTGAGAPALPAPPPPVDLDALGVTRRQFLNRAILGTFGLSLTGFGAACLGFLWPTLTAGGFGGTFTFKKADIDNYISANKSPFYNAQARTYINPYPVAAVPKATASKTYADPIINGMKGGYVALYQKCVHLGCRVPWCVSSQWFECPCHGSQYNRVGEKKGGPAPRGLDRFTLTVSGDTVSVNTGALSQGPPIGTNTTGQEAEGPHCH